jgi:hypothetical protein
MRNLHLLDIYRIRGKRLPAHFKGYAGDHTCGAFEVQSPIDRAPLMIIASSDLGWEHVSVSRRNRCPNWAEMSHIKDLFFGDGETVMQLRVPATDHVNDHPYCLHLWRPTKQDIPRPPAWMVGGCSHDEADAEMRKLEAEGRS